MESLNGSGSHYNDTPWFILECTMNLDHHSRRIAIFLLYLLFFMVGLAENAVVLWVNWRRRHMASTVLFCVLNMTVSDTTTVLVMPFFMLEAVMNDVWLWGHFLCKFTHLVFCVNFYSSSFFLAYMTLERYLALTRPPAQAGGQGERRRRVLICMGLWALSLLLAVLENVHLNLGWYQPGCFLMPEYSHVEWFTTFTFLRLIFQFLGPASVIITCNVLIARAARSTPDVQGGRCDIWLLHLYSLVFVVCWLPYQLVFILMMVAVQDLWFFSCNMVDVLIFSISVVETVSLAHCVANPILYNFLSKSFRVNLVNAVLERIPRASGDDPARGANQVGEAGPDKERKMSNTSTSHSDVPS